MIKIGEYNTLAISKYEKGGCFLEAGESEIYLSKKDTPKNSEIGDTVKVFIYNDAKNSLKATTQIPKAVLNEFAVLEVVSVAEFGVFLDWGIEKDLFVPVKYQRTSLIVGSLVVVRLILDYEKTGVIGTCRLDSYFDKNISILSENQKVELVVFSMSAERVRVIINRKYCGVLYKNEIFQKIRIGDIKTGYIKKIREDGLIDVALQPQGFIAASGDAKEVIIKALKKNSGFLPLHDKSSPEKIKNKLNLSKKIFKKTIGVLYKEGIIKIEENSIHLITEEKEF